jgi:hypothetical protein
MLQTLNDRREYECTQHLKRNRNDRIKRIVEDCRPDDRIVLQAPIIIQTDKGSFTGEDILICRTDDKIIDDWIVDKPQDQNECDQNPAERK